MLRSLALSLAASTAAQFLHANQPTDPPSTHRLTNHPTPPLCHLVHPQSPHTPVSLPLTASNASPSSLWTATFAHVPSPPLSFSLHPHSIATLLLFLLPFPRTISGPRTFSHSVPPLSFPIYTMLFSQTNIPVFECFFFLSFFLLFLFFSRIVQDFSFATK